MSDIGYEKVRCQLKLAKNCSKTHAGYSRRAKYAQTGPWLDACENCARIPYEQPAQFQETKNETQSSSVG
jgi:hypothetical protein